MADDTSSLADAHPVASIAPPPAKVFAGHGFWRYDIASATLTWADSHYQGVGPMIFDAAEQGEIWEAVHPADRERFHSLMYRAATCGEGYTHAFRFKAADGSWRVISNHGTAQKDPEGAVIAVSGVVLDITEIEICRTLSEAGNDIITQTDAGGIITYISPSVEKVTGFTPSELVGRSVADVLGYAAARALEDAVRGALLNSEAGPKSVEYSVKHKAGQIIWLESRVIALLDPLSGARIGTTDVARDITARKAAETKLERANILLKTLMEASPSAIIMLSNEGKITSFNHTFAEMWNVPGEILESGNANAVLDTTLLMLKDADEARRGVGQLLKRIDEPSWDEIETADGRTIDRYTVPVRAADKGYLGRAWFFRDVTEHKHALAEAVRMARFDHLTGLANRSVLIETLERSVSRARREGVGHALFYLDLDEFKDVNDTLGHLVGDQLLVAVADRLRSHCPTSHLVARLGGDEFAILVQEPWDTTAAAKFAESLISLISAPYTFQDSQIRTSVSIGIELFGSGASDAPTVLSHADMALIQAKKEGAGSHRFFSEAMDIEVRTRVTLASELRQAIETDQLFLVYQPAVALATGTVVGVEALVRWRHPKHGVLGPDLFIPVAEQMGLIGGLGRWVLREATRQMRAWDDQGLPNIRMGVNVSALQFKTPEVLEADIESALVDSGLPPWRLELELTESALMTAAEGGDVLARLHRMGVRIAIDDFGTGYSSLDYLRRLPAHRIKIAQSFVRHLDSSPGDAAIVKATIGLAHDLGMTVIAEGVETNAQLRRLVDWGCGECQGYYFDKPMSPEEAVGRLRLGGYADRGEVQAA